MQQFFDHKTQAGENQEALCKCQALALPVIPRKGKKARLEDWLSCNAPPIAVEIAEWMERQPEPNIGLVMETAPSIVGVNTDGEMALERPGEISSADTWVHLPRGSEAGKSSLCKLPVGVGKALKWSKKLNGVRSKLTFLGKCKQTRMTSFSDVKEAVQCIAAVRIYCQFLRIDQVKKQKSVIHAQVAVGRVTATLYCSKRKMPVCLTYWLKKTLRATDAMLLLWANLFEEELGKQAILVVEPIQVDGMRMSEKICKMGECSV